MYFSNFRELSYNKKGKWSRYKVCFNLFGDSQIPFFETTPGIHEVEKSMFIRKAEKINFSTDFLPMEIRLKAILVIRPFGKDSFLKLLPVLWLIGIISITRSFQVKEECI